MSYEPLLEERYAPDQYRVLVTCIFLNKTRATLADPLLQAFFEEYPTAQNLRAAKPRDVAKTYFRRLGLYRRAWWLVEMADQLVANPPRPNVFWEKSCESYVCISEVAHLSGVGQYASDAWRLFCKQAFYARNGITVDAPWKTLQPADKDLKRYVQHKKGEEHEELLRAQADDLASRLMSIRLSDETVSPSNVVVGSGDNALHVPQRIVDRAAVASYLGPSDVRAARVVARVS